jgi:SAM-dependent methyltransferase
VRPDGYAVVPLLSFAKKNNGGGSVKVPRLREDFLRAYAREMDVRVRQDPYEAVGGLWDEIGRLQFDYLCAQGLKPVDRFLDIGCGTLRGGRHFIRYLNPGNYVGLDLSPEAVHFARNLVSNEGLAEKNPRIVLTDGGLTFEQLEGETFDYILAQSVFTHLGPVQIEECFRHIGAVLNPAGVFFFTFGEAARVRRLKDFVFLYPFDFFEQLATASGLRLARLSDFEHPRRQILLKAFR